MLQRDTLHIIINVVINVVIVFIVVIIELNQEGERRRIASSSWATTSRNNTSRQVFSSPPRLPPTSPVGTSSWTGFTNVQMQDKLRKSLWEEVRIDRTWGSTRMAYRLLRRLPQTQTTPKDPGQPLNGKHHLQRRTYKSNWWMTNPLSIPWHQNKFTSLGMGSEIIHWQILNQTWRT